MMMNSKEFGRKLLWPNFKVLSWCSPGGTEENHEKPQDSWSLGLRLEPGTSRIQSKSVNHLSMTFGKGCYWVSKKLPLLLYVDACKCRERNSVEFLHDCI
jgi:hypothetical protein